MSEHDIHAIGRELETIGEAPAWIESFRGTGSELCLVVVAPGGDKLRLYLQGCSYLSGPTSWRSPLRVSQSASEVTLATEGDGFKAIGSRLWLATLPPPAPTNVAAGVRALAEAIAALPTTPPGAPTPAVVADTLDGLRTITAMLSGAEDRSEDIVARFQTLAGQHPELRRAAEAALAMSIRVLP